MLYIDHYYEYPNSNNPYPEGLPMDYPELFEKAYRNFLNTYDKLLSYLFSNEKGGLETIKDWTHNINGPGRVMIAEGIQSKYHGIDIANAYGPYIFMDTRVFIYAGEKDSDLNPVIVHINKSFNRNHDKINNMLSIIVSEYDLERKDFRRSLLSAIVVKFMDLYLVELGKMNPSDPSTIILTHDELSYYILYLYLKTYFKIMMSVTNINKDDLIKSILTKGYYTHGKLEDFAKGEISVLQNIFKFAKKDLADIDYEESDDELLDTCRNLIEYGYIWRYDKHAGH